MSFRITSLTAFTQIGLDDEEGLIGMASGDMWVPLVAADERRLEQLRPFAQAVANATGRPVRMRRFETVVEVDTLEPRMGGGGTPADAERAVHDHDVEAEHWWPDDEGGATRPCGR